MMWGHADDDDGLGIDVCELDDYDEVDGGGEDASCFMW